MSNPLPIAIIGAGISGLAIAHELRRADHPVVILEAGEQPGGCIRTGHELGYTFEWGPNGFLDNVPAMLELIDRLGLTRDIERASEAARRRYIYRHGALHQLPTNPFAFLGWSAISRRARLRALLAPFCWAPSDLGEETVFQMGARRIGAEAAEVLIGAMVRGVFGGDARELSMTAAFPKVAKVERNVLGTLMSAMGKRKGSRNGQPPKKRGRTTLTTLKGGMGRLIGALADEQGEALRLGARVTGITEGSRSVTIGLADGGEVEAAAVIVTIPAPAAATLLEPLDGELAGALQGIPTAPLAVLALGYEEAAMPAMVADGFGFLVPPGEPLGILGCLWSSSVFSDRAPQGQVLLRIIMGGAQDPGAASLPEEQLIGRVKQALATSMGLEAEPGFTRIMRHPIGIPQYVLGHGQRLAQIESRLADHPRLVLAGNSYLGVSMNHCVDNAAVIAARATSAAALEPTAG